jgi:hypothetical protein
MAKKSKKLSKGYDKEFIYVLECGGDETGW